MLDPCWVHDPKEGEQIIPSPKLLSPPRRIKTQGPSEKMENFRGWPIWLLIDPLYRKQNLNMKRYHLRVSPPNKKNSLTPDPGCFYWGPDPNP